MARRLALRTEIAARLHQTRAEKLLPEPIHRHARGQRVLRRDQPPCEVKPIWQFVRRRRFERREDDRHRARDRFARLVIPSAHHDVRSPRLRQVAHDEGCGERRLKIGALFPEAVALGHQRREGHLGRGADIGHEMVAQAFLLLGRAVLRRLFENPLHLAGQIAGWLAVVPTHPGRERERWVRSRIDSTDHAALVPHHRPAELREGKPGHLSPRLQPHLGRRNLETHPLTRLRQRPHVRLRRRVRRSKRNRLIVAPHRPMLPPAHVELEHDRLWKMVRIEKDVGKECRFRRNQAASLPLRNNPVPAPAPCASTPSSR